MTPEEELALLGGGDCTLHSHSFDRDISHDQVLQFQASENVRVVTTTGVVTYNDDILVVNTTSGAVTLTLPKVRGGKTYSIVRTAGANAITIVPTAGDTINLTSSVSISSNFVPMRLKAVKGMGWLQV